MNLLINIITEEQERQAIIQQSYERESLLERDVRHYYEAYQRERSLKGETKKYNKYYNLYLKAQEELNMLRKGK